MLILKPNCEFCDVDLAADASNARICSYECTFCADCVENILHNVCPNCGGGFVSRPIRPAQAHRPGVSREHHPPSTERVNTKLSQTEISDFSASLQNTEPSDR